MSLIHINTNAALLPKATEEIARQTRMKKEGLVCSENLTHSPSIYGGKNTYWKGDFATASQQKKWERIQQLKHEQEGGITKFGIFPAMMSHWQRCTDRNTGDLLPSRKKASAMPGETSGQDWGSLGFLACWSPRQGNSSCPSTLSLSWSSGTPFFLLLLQASSHNFPQLPRLYTGDAFKLIPKTFLI